MLNPTPRSGFVARTADGEYVEGGFDLEEVVGLVKQAQTAGDTSKDDVVIWTGGAVAAIVFGHGGVARVAGSTGDALHAAYKALLAGDLDEARGHLDGLPPSPAGRLPTMAVDLAEKKILPSMPGLLERIAEELRPPSVQPATGRPGARATRARAALDIGLALVAAHGWPQTAEDLDDWARKAVSMADRLHAILDEEQQGERPFDALYAWRDGSAIKETLGKVLDDLRRMLASGNTAYLELAARSLERLLAQAADER